MICSYDTCVFQITRPDLFSLSAFLPLSEHTCHGLLTLLLPSYGPGCFFWLMAGCSPPSRPPQCVWNATGLSPGPNHWDTLSLGDLIRLPTYKYHSGPQPALPLSSAPLVKSLAIHLTMLARKQGVSLDSTVFTFCIHPSTHLVNSVSKMYPQSVQFPL